MFKLDSEHLRRPVPVVPCGGCNECCRGDALSLHPEAGDDETQYVTEPGSNGPNPHLPVDSPWLREPLVFRMIENWYTFQYQP